MTDAATVALIGGLLGGGGVVELIRRLVPTRRERSSLQAQFTEQVVKRVDALDAQMGALRREADKWREQYFTERETNSRLSGEVILLRGEVAEGKERITELEQEVGRLETRVKELSLRSA